MKKIYMIMLLTSISLWADFSRDDTTQIVTDSNTGLEWQDDAIGSTMNWQSAIDYCEDTLSLDGHDDWRLPNINELKTLIDRSKYDPVIVRAFSNFSYSDYCSSTINKSNSNDVWIVNFGNGKVKFYNKSNEYYNNSKGYYVRCVRAGE